MNTTYKALSILAATALFVGCSNYEETNGPAPEGERAFVKIQAAVAANDGTRANIEVGENSFTGEWEDEDALGVLYSRPGASDFSAIQKFSYNTGEFAFEGELPNLTGDWQYLGFYPHAAISGTKASIPFGNLRTQKGNAFDSNFDALVAEGLSFSNAGPGKTDQGEAVAFRLNRLTSILNLSVKGGSVSDAVRYILLTSENAAQTLSAQSIDFDIARMGSDLALSETAPSNVIALGFETGSAPAANQLEAFFNILPGSYDKLTLDVITSANQIGTVVIERDKPFVAGKLYKRAEVPQFGTLAAPSLEWPGQDMDEVHLITLNDSGWGLSYDAAISINAPGAIAALEVKITSAALNGIGLETLDLFNEEMELPGIISSTAVQYKKSTVFNITELVPMITVLPGADPGSDHVFEVVVTDLAGQTTRQALTFRVPSPVTYNGSDLWANTASFTFSDVAENAQTVSFVYRKEGAEQWQSATIGSDRKSASIAPEWDEMNAPDWSTPNTVLPYSRIKAGTGVFAGNTYEYKLTADGKEFTGTFTPGAGQTIPHGDMEDSSLPCFVLQHASSTSDTWGSGNNKVIAACWLCQQDTYTLGGVENKCAKLTSGTQNTYIFGRLLTAGNLFLGQFTQVGTGGDVRFGQKYDWQARPSAMQVKYKATVGNVDYVNTSTLVNIPKGSPDKARIFVAIVDWETPHTVTSTLKVATGLPATVKGAWDPETAMSQEEGRIIGYGSLWIEAGTTDWQTIDIPMNYYDKTARPTEGNYSLVVSCACNAFGEYFNGCSTNVMSVDDFQWVY